MNNTLVNMRLHNYKYLQLSELQMLIILQK